MPPPAPPRRDAPPLVDFAATGRRLARTAMVLLGGAVVVWLIVGVATGGPRVRGLWTYVGVAIAAMFVAEVVVVGGAALRGMLNAGDRGERLAGTDVGLLPPQVGRMLRGRASSDQ
jgi:hypothetical protein